MSTAAINRHQELIDKLPPASTLILHDIGWEEYEELLDALGEAKGLRISFSPLKLGCRLANLRPESHQRSWWIIHT
ncbi:MAG: hypothetical protein DMF60_00130 [Acidobacteria bacterium]|nr:MAG: hypothetical protein DMF60_00130 [Acidobacteriota bacterium]